jgi:hypothetical protein
MTRMRIVQLNSMIRCTIPATIGMKNSKKSGIISFHVIVFCRIVQGFPWEKPAAQPSFVKGTSFAIIKSVHTMPAKAGKIHSPG